MKALEAEGEENVEKEESGDSETKRAFFSLTY